MRHHSIPTGRSLCTLPTSVYLIGALEGGMLEGPSWECKFSNFHMGERYPLLLQSCWEQRASQWASQSPSGIHFNLQHLQCWLFLLILGHQHNRRGHMTSLLWGQGCTSTGLFTTTRAPEGKGSGFACMVDPLSKVIYQLVCRCAHQDHIKLLSPSHSRLAAYLLLSAASLKFFSAYNTIFVH